MNEEPRWFWWSSSDLTYRWKPFYWGGDEWCRRTLGFRLPGGVFFLCLWRFDDAKGPCARCGLWEPAECWPADVGEHCPACHGELADYAAGCTCPSFMTAEYDDWPDPACGVHAHLRSVCVAHRRRRHPQGDGRRQPADGHTRQPRP